MNPRILLPLLACLAVLFNTVADAAAPRGRSLDFIDMPVTSTSLLPHYHRVERQAVKQSGIRKARGKLGKQFRRLRKLGCKPKWTKIYVKEYIKGDNEILDQDPHPEVVVVKRCIKSCSYCGNSGSSESKECYPKIERNKTVIVLHNDTDNTLKYYRVQIPEHKKCHCI